MFIILGSKSSKKIKVAQKIAMDVLNTHAHIEGYAAKSCVPETPYSEETFIGARNRAIDSKNHDLKADLYIGLESGLVERYGHLYEEAWAVVIDFEGKEYYGYSSGLKVPDFIVKKMDQLQKPHSEIMELLEKELGISTLNDTWGTYSGGLLLRDVSLEESLRNAFIQICAPHTSFYKKK